MHALLKAWRNVPLGCIILLLVIDIVPPKCVALHIEEIIGLCPKGLTIQTGCRQRKDGSSAKERNMQ